VSVQQVMARMGQVQARVEQLKQTVRPGAFARELAAAQQARSAASSASAGAVNPSAEPTIGLFGSPVSVAPGHPSRRTGPATWIKPPPVGTSQAPAGWAGNLPQRAEAWVPAIEAAAGAVGLDPRLLASLVWAESEFNPNAISRSGAIGLSQLMPKTAEGLGVDPYNPLENLNGGARYLQWAIDEFGSYELGLAAYNAGPGRVREAGFTIPNIAETQAYVPKVMNYFKSLGG
jgi:soluble lytic murein transglycosylase-like protein